jgi:septal ring factor EnvC (AmiA/AmiB activator)
LESQEDEIETIRSRIETLEQKKTKQQARLTRFLNDLEVD